MGAIQKTTGTGYQQLGPVTHNVTFTQIRGATGNAIYITGVEINPQGTSATGEDTLVIGVGGSGSEVTVASVPVPALDNSGSAGRGPNGFFAHFKAYIPVAAGTRIAVRSATGVFWQTGILFADQTDIASV